MKIWGEKEDKTVSPNNFIKIFFYKKLFLYPHILFQTIIISPTFPFIM